MSECELCDAIAKDKSPKPKLTRTGKILLGITGASFATMCAVTAPFLWPALRKVCLPYVPATTEQVNNVMNILKGQTGRLIDLGSGDGRIVISAAKAGWRAEGIELNPWLVAFSRLSAWRHGVSRSTAFYTRDLWKHDLSKYDSVVIFGVESMMPQLQKKLCEELRRDGRVVACRFPLPSWQPDSSLGKGIDTVWLYKRQEKKF